MPPGQPIHRCQGRGCGLLRPCKGFQGRWLCVDCAPIVHHNGRAEAATDGGEPR